MVDLPDDATAPAQPTNAPTQTTPEPSLPKPDLNFSQLEELDVPPIPEPAEITIPKPTPTPRPVKNEPKRMSIEEFRRMHGTPQTPTQAPRSQPTRPTVNIPQFDTSAIRHRLNNAANQDIHTDHDTHASAAQQAYPAKIRGIINSLWNPDPSLPAQSLVAELEFRIDGRGRVVKYRWVRRSGLAQFDASIEQVFEQLRDLPPPPDQRPHTYTIPFALR